VYMQKYRIVKERFTENGSIAITSITKGNNNKLYIGFTSLDHPVIEYDTKTGTYNDIGVKFNQPANNVVLHDKVHNSLAMDENGILYIGQGLNINWEAGPYGFDLHKYGGGHLFSYDTSNGKIVDFGIIVPLNAIHGITYNQKTRRIYGYTIPDNHFFRFDIDSQKVIDYGKISPYACHNYVTDNNGNAYGAWLKSGIYDESERNKFFTKGTFLLKYDCLKDELIRTKNMIVYGLEYDIFCNIGVDSWICTKHGEIFGGTAIGGYIFKVNRDDSIQLIGKPVLGPRLTSMTEGNDGLIYGCAGFPHMSLFSMNPDTYEIKDLGTLSTEGEFWYLHCITMGNDGVIYGGETDAGNACLVKIIPE
jgi:hypothetical protein